MTDPSSARSRLEERLVQARTDVDELAAQVDAGEIDADTAARLESGYRGDIASLEAELETLPNEMAAGRSPRRVLVGAVILVVAITAVVLLAVQSIAPRDGGSVSGLAAETVDLDTISNDALEAVVAANVDHPQINGMRMALADRYFQVGDFRASLPHYQAVLETNPDGAEAPIAFARVGWMFYQSGGEPEVAAEYLREGLARAPSYIEAKLYLAVVSLYGLEDPAAARPLLSELAAASDLPADVRTVVEQALADAERGEP